MQLTFLHNACNQFIVYTVDVGISIDVAQLLVFFMTVKRVYVAVICDRAKASLIYMSDFDAVNHHTSHTK